MPGLMGGSWKRGVCRGQGHRIWAPEGNLGDERRAYRSDPLPRQLPTRLRPGMSTRTLGYLSSYLWGRVIAWLRRKHRRITWKELRRRYCDRRWWPSGQQQGMFNPAKVRTTRYRYRGVI